KLRKTQPNERFHGVIEMRGLKAGFLLLPFALVTACGDESGDACETTADCPSGQICSLNQCLASEGDGGIIPGDSNNNNENPVVEPPPFVNINNNLNGNEPDDGIDNTPPTIIIREPEPYDPRTGNVLILVDVIDLESGVDVPSVRAVIADSVIVPLVAASDAGVTNTTFTAVWDSTPFSDFLAPTLEIIATDVAENTATVGSVILLDYAPPVIDLEPGDVVPRYRSPFGGRRCGPRFPMLGDTAIRQGQVISRSSTLDFYPRAQIVDENSQGPFSSNPRSAGVDESTVIFALMDQAALATGVRFVTSDRADNRCNRINPDVIKPGDFAEDSPEFAIVQGGARTDRVGFPTFAVTSLPAPVGGCDGFGPSADDAIPIPNPPCDTVDGAIGIFASVGGSPDSDDPSRVFVLNSYDAERRDLCAGGLFDASNFIADGPACVTVEATDNVGNVGVGLPLYICIDKDDSGDCVGFAPTPADVLQNCTDGCVTNDIDFGLDPRTPQSVFIQDVF
ncbi:MAG: hypothetical protein AAF658_07235, partial [Myxococcota bacterium]